MSDTLIYSLIMSKATNLHYAKRYLSFIERCDGSGSVKHHVLPKAKDMWPEYASFKKHPWNCSLLTERQHFIAHRMLWKALGGSQCSAFWRMASKTSKTYQKLREDYTNNHKKFLSEWYNNGGRKIRSEGNTKLLMQGLHPFQLNDTNTWRLEAGIHPFQKDGFQKELAQRRISEGTHPTCEFKGTVSAVNKQGERKRIPAKEFHSQTGPREEWEWVGPNSKEGKKRL